MFALQSRIKLVQLQQQALIKALGDLGKMVILQQLQHTIQQRLQSQRPIHLRSLFLMQPNNVLSCALQRIVVHFCPFGRWLREKHHRKSESGTPAAICGILSLPRKRWCLKTPWLGGQTAPIARFCHAQTL